MAGSDVMGLRFLAAAGEPGGGAGMVFLIQIAAFAAIVWFILIRPSRQAQKRHQAMLEALRKGDQVVTEGGILGEVIHLKENEVTIRTGENTRLVVIRGKIARVLTGEGAES